MKMNNVMGACVVRRRAWGRGALAAVLAGSLALTGCAGGNFEDAADEGGEQKTEQGQNAPQTADGESYELAEGEDEPNAALFSKDDLTLNGMGALTIEGNYRHGVSSEDDLVINGGAITVTAKEDGLRGKDCMKIADGQFAITAAGDGVKSSNDEDPMRGFVSIDGGTFSVEAGDEGMQAATYLRLAGGEAQIAAADHALRSDIGATMTDGAYVVEAGGKGMNPETKFTMDGGIFTVTGCEEGIEAQEVVINDGELDITASDDGINAALAERNSNDAPTDAAADESTDTATEGLKQNGGTPPEPPSGNGAPEGDFGGRGGMGGPGGGAGGPIGANASEDCLIQINGGSVTINAGGDAVDSNGYVEVTGGTLLGASSGQGDSALDYESFQSAVVSVPSLTEGAPNGSSAELSV